MKSERERASMPLPSRAVQVVLNAWRRLAIGGCIFADAPNAVTSAAVIVRLISTLRNITRPRGIQLLQVSSREKGGSTTTGRGIFFAGPNLAAPHSHPLDQPVPGPAG